MQASRASIGVLNAARWSALDGARLLLLLIVAAFVPEGPVVIGLDDTIERRKGSRIAAKGIYRDPVRSSKGCFVKVSGLRWLSLMVVARVPFARAVWGLPFLTVLCPSERAAAKAGKRHKKLTDWARQALLQVRRWLPGRTIVVVADSGYAVIELGLALIGRAVMISRLRLDARLFEPAPPRQPGQVGRPRRVGRELPKLAAVAEDPDTRWTPVELASRKDGRQHRCEMTSGTAVWYHPGSAPLPLRWVLVRRFDGNRKTEAFFSTDPGHGGRGGAAAVRAPLADGGDVLGGQEASRGRDPAPMVGPRHRPRHADAARPVLAGRAVGRHHPGRGRRHAADGLVPQDRPDLRRRARRDQAADLGGTDFLDVPEPLGQPKITRPHPCSLGRDLGPRGLNGAQGLLPKRPKSQSRAQEGPYRPPSAWRTSRTPTSRAFNDALGELPYRHTSWSPGRGIRSGVLSVAKAPA